MKPQDSRIDQAFRRIGRGLATAALVLVVLVLAGWGLDVERLRRPSDTAAGMSPVTACTLGTLALAALAGTAAGRPAQWASHALAALGGGVGFVVLGAELLGEPADLNELVFGVEAQIAMMTVLLMTLLGFALVIRGAGTAGLHVARLAVLGAIGIAGAALVGYALGVGFFYGADRTVEMAPATAIVGLLVAGAAAAIVRGPLQEMLMLRSLGGQFLRTALPVVALVQIAGGALTTAGVRADVFAPATGVWLMTMCALLCLFVLVVFSALRLHAAELQSVRDAERLEELARRDPLTGGLNRRAFSEEIDRAIEHVQRYGGSCAVCVIDLDNFKEVNDTYGHQAGDEALVRVYRALRGRLRTTDVLGRLGGDEFVALLPHADEHTAQRVSAELAVVVDDVARELAAEGCPSRLGASVGCAVTSGADTAAVLLDRADVRMYAAKRAARAA